MYDGFTPVQSEHGVLAHKVLRSIDSPNDVIVTHTFDSPESARAFFELTELKDAMRREQASIPGRSRSNTSTRSRAARWSARRGER